MLGSKTKKGLDSFECVCLGGGGVPVTNVLVDLQGVLGGAVCETKDTTLSYCHILLLSTNQSL